MRHVGYFTRLLDLVEACLLSVLFLATLPINFLRSVSLKQVTYQIRLLLPFGILAALVRAGIDYRLGYFDRTIAALESMIGAVEEAFDEEELMSVQASRALRDLYGFLTLVHLRTGHVEEASHAMIRANRSLGVARLKVANDLDVKTAQIVKAGIAAGKIMEEGGIASFLFPGGADNPFKTEFPPKSGRPNRSKGAKVIPFPTQHQ